MNKELNEKYKFISGKAKEFILELISKHFPNPEEILDKYIYDQSKYETLNDANKRLIQSMSNRNMMASVIAFDKRKVEMEEIFLGYSPQNILDKYKNGYNLLGEFVLRFKGIDVSRKGNLWQQFADGIISGSKFMSVFKNKEEFDTFVKRFSLNTYTKASLPMLLEKEIKGFGFALACDFLKELGYRDYPKPDVHLIEIFYQTGLCESKIPYDVYKSIIEMSEIVGVDAYTLDKIFWLIGSGRMYLDNIVLGQNRDKFINLINTND
ncbi:MAG: hypothetical protein WAZ12_01165 [Candidatus Absconditicoccaceae bacterium]